MRVAFAVFFLVLGLANMTWALFLVLGWPGLLLMGGALLAGVGLLGIPLDRGEP